MTSPIGIIHTPFSCKEEAPIQGAFHPEYAGTVEVFPEYVEALDGIDGFSHLFLLYEFDRAVPPRLRCLPFLTDEPKGLFATRFPSRPNNIGLTVVTLLARKGTLLEVGMIDVLDGTPLLDIKPYIPRFDAFPEASEGWFAGCSDRPKPPGRE